MTNKVLKKAVNNDLIIVQVRGSGHQPAWQVGEPCGEQLALLPDQLLHLSTPHLLPHQVGGHVRFVSSSSKLTPNYFSFLHPGKMMLGMITMGISERNIVIIVVILLLLKQNIKLIWISRCFDRCLYGDFFFSIWSPVLLCTHAGIMWCHDLRIYCFPKLYFEV